MQFHPLNDRSFVSAILCGVVLLSTSLGRAQTVPDDRDATALNMRLVGVHELDARSAYQPIVHAYGERRILFVGHHAGEQRNSATDQVERNGLSILDVTDPAAPRYLRHVPPTGSEANGTQHVQICDGRALPDADPSKVYAVRTNGGSSFELLDVTDPADPFFVTTLAETGASSRPQSGRGNRETHKTRFIPEVTANTVASCIEIDGVQHCDRAIQTNNLAIDDRGYIYALDRASTGLHIVELTGEARAIIDAE